MKSWKELISVALSVVLTLGATACSKGGTDGSTGSPSPSVSSKASEKAADPANDKSKSDLGGRTIRIAAWWDDSPKPDTDTGKALVEQQKKVEQKYNIKIEYVNVPFNDYVQKFTTTVLAGQPFADIVRLQYDWALGAVTKGQLLKLNSYIDITKSKNLQKGYPLKGEDYGFSTKGATNDGGILYNRELFKKLGLTDPQELVQQGKWNWDEFEKLAKQATQDTNNDGKPDTWGWSGWDAEAGQFFIVSNGGTIADDTAGKEMLSDPKTIEAIDFLNKLYNVDKVVKVKKGDVNLWEERTTFGDGDVAMSYGWGWLTDEYKKKNIDYGYVPFPKGPKGTDFVNPMSGGHAWFIPKGVDKPEVVERIYDELKDVPSKESYPGQDWLEMKFKTQKDIDLIRKMEGKEKFMNFGAYPEYPYNTFVGNVIKDQVPAATAAEKLKQSAQASIDKLLKAQ